MRSESEGEIRRLTVMGEGNGGEGTEDGGVEVRRKCALKDEGQRREKKKRHAVENDFIVQLSVRKVMNC